MTPEIFAGLGKPTTPLFYDIQALIAENGGRLHLANKIEGEWLKIHKFKKLKHEPIIFQYNKEEDSLIVANYLKMDIRKINTLLPHRSYASIKHRLMMLRKKKLITYKAKYKL